MSAGSCDCGWRSGKRWSKGCEIVADHQLLATDAIDDLLADSPYMADREQQEELVRAAYKRGWNDLFAEIQRELGNR
jgi:hypothetical protein